MGVAKQLRLTYSMGTISQRWHLVNLSRELLWFTAFFPASVLGAVKPDLVCLGLDIVNIIPYLIT